MYSEGEALHERPLQKLTLEAGNTESLGNLNSEPLAKRELFATSPRPYKYRTFAMQTHKLELQLRPLRVGQARYEPYMITPAIIGPFAVLSVN